MNSRSMGWLAPLIALGLFACQEQPQEVQEPQETAETQAAADPDPFRLSPDIRPEMQELALSIDPGQANYSGWTTIRIAVEGAHETIRLHAEDMQITDLELSSAGEVIDSSHESGEHGLLIVTPVESVGPGSYELRIDFTNDFNTDGVGINRTERDGDHYIFSQFEAIDAREAFPCFDEPGFKFPWQLTMTVPESVMAITNTPEENVSREGGMVTTTFAATPPLPSYLIAVAVGPFEAVPIDGLPIPGRVITPRGKAHLAAFAAETTPPLLEFLEGYFGEPYPYKKLDLIATYQSFAGAMEHPGAITYSDFFLLLDETASASDEALLVRITAHELAHQWFGNLVTMKWWDDLWLNESFADWMGDKTTAAVYPEYGQGLDELRTIFRIMDVDMRPTTKPIRHSFSATDNFEDGVFLSYYKGKATLGMFEEAVGEDVFREGVVRYLRQFHRGNAEASDLWASINAGAEFDLSAGLASFIDQPGIPLVSVEPLGNGTFEFSQRRLSTDRNVADDQVWMIPMVYSYLTPDGLETGELLLDKRKEVVDLGNDVTWVMPNADSLGYYRWNVPSDMMTQLGEDAADYLNVRERMGMLSNLWALLATDQLDGDGFMAAVRGVARDTDASVLMAVLDQMGNIRQTFITPELRDDFADYVVDALAPTLERLGPDPLPGEDAETADLRSQTLLWLADYGRDPAARAVTADYTQRYLAGEIPASDHVSVAMRVQARLGDKALLDQYLEAFEAAETPADKQRLLAAIGSFRDPKVVPAALEFVLTDSLTAIEMGTVLVRLAGWDDNRPMVLDWLIEHDGELRARLPEGMMSRIPDAMTSCSTELLPRIIEFYGAPERAVLGIESELEDTKAEVLECSALRNREIDAVRQYLDEAA